jgi:hypothetical protein
MSLRPARACSKMDAIVSTVRVYARAHAHEATRYNKIHKWFNVPNQVLSVAVTVFSGWSVVDAFRRDDTLGAGISVLCIIGAVYNSVVHLSSWREKASDHRQYASKFAEFERELTLQGRCAVDIDVAKERLSRYLNGMSPEIRDRTIEQSETEMQQLNSSC